MNLIDEDMDKWFPPYDETVSIETLYETQAKLEKERHRRIEAEEDLEWVLSRILRANTMEELKESLKEDIVYEKYN